MKGGIDATSLACSLAMLALAITTTVKSTYAEDDASAPPVLRYFKLYLSSKLLEENHSHHFSVLPLVWLVIFTAAFMVGLGPIPWILLGELFPGND